MNKAQSSEGETGMPSTKGKDTGVASRNKLRDPQAEKEKKNILIEMQDERKNKESFMQEGHWLWTVVEGW